jgi:hypothetical protein
MRTPPSPWKILKHDNASFLLVCFGAIVVAMALFVLVTGEVPGGRHRKPMTVDSRSASVVLAYAIGIAGVLWVPAVLRIRRIRDLFASGSEVRATVRKVSTRKGYSTIHLDFEHGGTKRSLRKSIRQSPKAQGLEPGSLVGVLVDPMRPSALVLAELYD